MRQIKDKTDSYIVGDMACVTLYYKKDLIGKIGCNLSFGSKIKRGMDKWGGESAYLEIENLSFVEVDWLKEKEPNTHKLFSNSKAQLVICYGRQEWLSEKSAKHEISIADNQAFICWQVESIDYLNGIASAIKANKEISLRIEIACNDESISERLHDKTVKETIYKISILFDE